MTAAVRAVVVKSGAAGGSVIVSPETPKTVQLAMWSGGENQDAATAGNLRALEIAANTACDLAKNHCTWCE